MPTKTSRKKKLRCDATKKCVYVHNFG